LHDGRIGTLRHQSGATYKVRLHECRQEGDEFIFRLEILDKAEGSA